MRSWPEYETIAEPPEFILTTPLISAALFTAIPVRPIAIVENDTHT